VASTDPSALGRLRGLLEITRLVRSEDALPDLLAAIARTIGESLGYDTVAVHLYRPAQDDFEAAAVHGSPEAVHRLAGRVSPRAEWEALLASPADAPVARPVETSTGKGLAVPLRGADGELLGVVSVTGATGESAGDEQLEVLVAMSEHAALAVEAAQEAAALARHRGALEQLLSVSARLTESFSVDSILLAVCTGIEQALGFQTVWVELPDPSDGLFRTRARVGRESSAVAPAMTRDEVSAMLDPRDEIEGCFLLGDDTGIVAASVHKPSGGDGPRPWRDHRLIVPLWSRLGGLIGVIRVDDPRDQLVPMPLRLQALRVFANQATTALDSAAQYEEMQFLAEHDPLTRLFNRRAFNQRLAVETARAMRYAHPLALVLCDLNDFKALNDTHGHAAGDEALEQVGRVMAAALRRADAAFRIGGDEFALILPETTDVEARAVIGRITAALADTRIGDHPLSGCFGIAMCPHDGADPQELYRAADAALYASKTA
jgi:diguanylate cyclase (GGDEF)-like protein